MKGKWPENPVESGHPVNILGISAFYHDSAASLVCDGKVVAAVQEERFSRVKHDLRFPESAIRYCMEEGGVTPESLDLIAFHEKPFIHFERLLETFFAYAPRGLRQFRQAIPAWLRQKLWIKDIIRKETGFTGRIIFPSHHQSHAAAAFFPSPFEAAAILTMDGVGEWATASYGTGEGNRIEIVGELRFPHSLGLLYSAFTVFTGFAINSGEYKMMGLAPYGEPVYKDIILTELMDLREDGSFRLNMEYFDYCSGLTMTSRRFHALFGALPRVPGSAIRRIDMDLARSVQEVAEEVILRMARFVKRETGLAKLVMSGGVALNSVANGKLEREGVFDEIWIQPAAGDAGSALGAALYGWHQYMDRERETDGIKDSMSGALLGPCFDGEHVERELDRLGAAFQRMEEPELLDKVTALIEQGCVVGWFQGRMEFGPRALGNRSILADARRPEVQARINRDVKFREGFRPFAPSILAEKAAVYFNMKSDSPYMLKVFPIGVEHLKRLTEEEMSLSGLDRLRAVRSDIPAVTHVDGSARVQTVEGRNNPLFAGLLSAFEKKTGCPLLLNTSFNVRGEPMVCTPEEAFRCFMVTGMDAMVIGPFLLDKEDQSDLKDPGEIAETACRTAGERHLRIFGISTGLGLVVMSLVVRWRFSLPFWWTLIVIGGFLAGAGFFLPGILAPVHRYWGRISSAVGRRVFTLCLALGYYGVLWPTALGARLTGRRFLEKGPDRAPGTYWEPCSPVKRESCERQY